MISTTGTAPSRVVGVPQNPSGGRATGADETIHLNLLLVVSTGVSGLTEAVAMVTVTELGGRCRFGTQQPRSCSMVKTEFTGGSLLFKGDKKAKKKKKSTRKHDLKKDEGVVVLERPDDEDLTSAEKRALKRRQERELEDLAKVAAKSHRDRVEEFNEKLGKETEHNDIPRVWFSFRFVHVSHGSHHLVFFFFAGQCSWKWLEPRLLESAVLGIYLRR